MISALAALSSWISPSKVAQIGSKLIEDVRWRLSDLPVLSNMAAGSPTRCQAAIPTLGMIDVIAPTTILLISKPRVVLKFLYLPSPSFSPRPFTSLLNLAIFSRGPPIAPKGDMKPPTALKARLIAASWAAPMS